MKNSDFSDILKVVYNSKEGKQNEAYSCLSLWPGNNVQATVRGRGTWKSLGLLLIWSGKWRLATREDVLTQKESSKDVQMGPFVWILVSVCERGN